MSCSIAQHTIIIANRDILVNHFLHNFWFNLPVLLGEFFALGLDLLDALVQHTGNATEAHSRNHKAQNESNNKFNHHSTLT